MFAVDKNRINGRSSWCKSCNAQHRMEYYLTHREKEDVRARVYSCLWKQENPDKVKAAYIRQKPKKLVYGKVWREANKERHKEMIISWRLNNPEKHSRIQKRAREKHMAIPGKKLNSQISIAICLSLYGNKSGRHWESLVNFNLHKLKQHLESQFKKGMTWGNYGKEGWEIDHIIPLAAFNFEHPKDMDFKRAWDLLNLQPLWGTENRTKNAKLEVPFQSSLLLTI